MDLGVRLAGWGISDFKFDWLVLFGIECNFKSEFISGQYDVGYGGRVGYGSSIGKGKWRGDVNISFSHFLELTSSRPSCSEMGLCGSCVVAATVNGGGGEVTAWTMEEEGVEEDNNCGVKKGPKGYFSHFNVTCKGS